MFSLAHDVVRKFTADYDKTLIFNKVHHELNQVWLVDYIFVDFVSLNSFVALTHYNKFTLNYLVFYPSPPLSISLSFCCYFSFLAA